MGKPLAVAVPVQTPSVVSLNAILGEIARRLVDGFIKLVLDKGSLFRVSV